MRNNYVRHHPERVAIARLMQGIKAFDTAKDYESRNKLIYAAFGLAAAAELKCGIRIDPLEPDWPVVYIELPTGQVSWHVAQHIYKWDQHTSETKYERVDAFGRMVGLNL